MRHAVLNAVVLLSAVVGAISQAVSRLLPARDLCGTDHVVLFSTCGRLDLERSHWFVPLHGWVHQPERDDSIRRLFIGFVGRCLGLVTDSRESAFLRERLGWFIVDNKRARLVRLRICQHEFLVGPTDPQGHFETEVTLPVDLAASNCQDGTIEVEVISKAHAARTFVGRVQLVKATGTSVISDVDDTVKLSQVLDRRELTRNTLLRPFRAVPEMAPLFRRWADRGMALHFVSCSPWHLYPAIVDFLRENGFPAATLVCRRFRLKDSSLRAFLLPPDEFKHPRIVELLNQYPGRNFLLVGDSGERDPEIYGRIAREYPTRILGVFIRNVTASTADDARWAQAFGGLERSRWRLFTDPHELDVPEVDGFTVQLPLATQVPSPPS